ncbi:hypothetical protein H4219_005136 [Mycoemilia scoparia]|uniref:Uncharacterized protein n=1 Tax=Mycoemilia scoparia TaxID=417184 RepID=A0A9W8DKD3_9FUNG|nr:hypothetical protein H4219_005136 [Mycoemilia scoparia]
MAYSAETIGFMVGVVFGFFLIVTTWEAGHDRQEQEYSERYLFNIPELRILRETFGPSANIYSIPADLCSEALRKWPYRDCGLTYWMLGNLHEKLFQCYKVTQLEEVTIQIPQDMAESLGIVLSKPAHEESIPSDGNIQMVDISFKITCTIRSERVSFFSFRVLNEFTKKGKIFSGANVDSNSGEILTDEEAEEIVNSEGSYQTEEPNNALSGIDQESCAVEIPEQCNDANIADCGSDFEDENEASPLITHKNGSIKPQAVFGSSSSASAAPPPLENLECMLCTDDIGKFTNHICYPNTCCCGQEYYCMDCIQKYGHNCRYCMVVDVDDAILRKEIPMHEFFGSVAAEVEKISRS